jgi:hypothetical protein
MSDVPSRPLPLASIRALSRDLAAAPDDRLTEAVALLDSLPDRGDADSLLDPVRRRLAMLHPRRPLTFCRLLFTPLDPLIVPPARWRAEDPTIPRTALVPIAETVRRAMGPDAAPVEAAIRGHSAQEATLLADTGAAFWPRAGQILGDAPDPVGWEHTGLRAAVYPTLARRIGALLRQLAPLQVLARDATLGRAPVDPERVTELLAAVADHEPAAQQMMTTLLLARAPQARMVLPQVAAALGPPADAMLRDVADQAIDFFLDQLETPGVIESQLGRVDLTQAAETVRRFGQLLREAEADAAPAHRSRAKAIRASLDTICRARFATGFSTDLLGRLQAVMQAPDIARIERLEATARGLRAFETEARGLGSGTRYDAQLRQAADAIRALPPTRALGLVDRVRLVEILAGPETALAMLKSAPAAAAR